MFKKIVIASVMLMFCASCGFALSSSIGYVDLQKVLSEYKETKKGKRKGKKKGKRHILEFKTTVERI